MEEQIKKLLTECKTIQVNNNTKAAANAMNGNINEFNKFYRARLQMDFIIAELEKIINK